ncbi:MAG: T9SS type A sorting domain-containing protein, partial [Bacteroidota bacterium]
SPRAGVTFRFKAEEIGASANFAEVDDSTTVAMAWETLTFELSGLGTTFNRIALFPDFGAMGAGEDFYLDEIQLQDDGPDPDPVKLPITFESATADYAPAAFGDATAAIIDNPDASGVNTSTKVLEVVKPTGAADFAGVAIALDEIVDLTPGAVFSVDVWSPTAGTPILLKFEDTTSPPDGNGNPSIFSELQVSTATAMGWETLSFDMSTAPTYDATHNYNQVVLFPNFGTMGADDTYYMDNILNVNAVSIDPEIFAGSEFKLYPNPGNGNLNLDFQLPISGQVDLQVMDMIGRTVKTIDLGQMIAGDYSQRLDLQNVQNGVYLVLMKVDGSFVKQDKVIIQR